MKRGIPIQNTHRQKRVTVPNKAKNDPSPLPNKGVQKCPITNRDIKKCSIKTSDSHGKIGLCLSVHSI